MDPALRAELRAAARRFFALPVATRSATPRGSAVAGWLAPGVESNGNADVFGGGEAVEFPPDLKESFAIGPATPTGDPSIDAVWFPPNVWPTEVPELRTAAERYLAAMTAVSPRPARPVRRARWACRATRSTALARHPTWTFNINRYPPLTEVGAPLPGQFRIGPHTDFGTVTVLDREPGAGGLQVDIDGRGWVDAPYDPDAFTVNIGDLLAHWTGLRWRSGRHRVLPPQARAPHEELVSLVFFFELDHDALVTPLAPPVGRRADLPPVVSAPVPAGAAGRDLRLAPSRRRARGRRRPRRA